MTPPASPAAAPPRRRPHPATVLLGLCMFSTGASGLVSEYVLATISTYLLGNSIEQFSIVIGLMLLMMGWAAHRQKHGSDALLVEKFIAVETLLAVLGASAPLGIQAAYAYMDDHFALVLYGYVMAIGYLIGFEIPLVLRINERYSEHLKANLGDILSLDYVGSFAGAVVWTYVLLRWLPLTETSVVVSAFNFAVAMVAILYFLRKGMVRMRRLAVASLVLTPVLLGVLYARNREWSARLEQRLYQDPIVFSSTTRYQHLVLTHRRAADETRLYINGNTQFSSSDEAIYHEQLVHPALVLATRRERVLVLGGGDGLALREVLKYPGVRSVTLVDLDPGMIRAAREHPVLSRLNGGAFADARVHARADAARSTGGRAGVFVAARGDTAVRRVATVDVYTVDADRFVEEGGEPYDVAVVDFPDPSSVELAKLYSREFYSKLRRRLAPGGMVVVQATSPYHAREAYLNIVGTLRASGFRTVPYHDNVPSFGDWGWVLAWSGGPSEGEMRERIAALREIPVRTRYLTPEVFRASLVFGKGMLVPAPENAGQPNTLMRPVLLRLYNRDAWRVE